MQNAQILRRIYYFELLNRCKFAHNRKTHKIHSRVVFSSSPTSRP